jgi:hypothetical protein
MLVVALWSASSRFSLFDLEFVSRLIGDRGSDNLSTYIDSNVGSGRALFHLDDLTFELIARAEFSSDIFSIDAIGRTNSNDAPPSLPSDNAVSLPP